ncbi:MAG: tetratricopeptide repeat protein [Oceanococcus sp.]
MMRSTSLLLLCALSACSVGPARHDSPPATSYTTGNIQSSSDASNLYKQAIDLLDAGDVNGAQSAFQNFVERYPNLSGGHTSLGILMARSDALNTAREHFSQAVALNPNNVAAWNWLASMQRQLGDNLAAERALLSALRAAPSDAASHRNLALLYDTHMNKPTQAIQHYRLAQSLLEQPELILEAWARQLSPDPIRTVSTEISQ